MKRHLEWKNYFAVEYIEVISERDLADCLRL